MAGNSTWLWFSCRYFHLLQSAFNIKEVKNEERVTKIILVDYSINPKKRTKTMTTFLSR
jgi:hypothetical protein